MASHHDLANFIWQIAELLRGPYRPPHLLRERRSAMIDAAVTGQIPIEEMRV